MAHTSRSVTQVLISFKIDQNNLSILDAICLERNLKRNRVLNYILSESLLAFVSNMSTFMYRRHLSDNVFPNLIDI